MITDYAVGAALSALISLVACRLLIRAGLQDMPNLARKAHRDPTPTAGGLGMGMGVGLALLALTFIPLVSWRAGLTGEEARSLAVSVGAAYLFLGLGFLDDTYALGPRLKLIVFVVASLLAALGAGVVERLPLDGFAIELGPVLGLIGSALWVFTLVNCVNFMDGANGLCMGSVAIGLSFLFVTALLGGAEGAAVFALCGAFALAGFLVWNFPHGRLFAGDSGALFAGAIAATASLMAVREGNLSPFIPPIFFFPLLADALLTLAWRASKKRVLLDGHAEHFYQIAIRGGLRHGPVALVYWMATALCGVLGFIAAQAEPGPGFASIAPVLAFAAVAVAALITSWLVRRFAVQRGLDTPQ
ncbi:MAG TPA: MraY family glycosyltransferase [Caulobacterales bacterium]|nr:MraY family glycosyltransferase [Caulobacterales bacterium]